jgi:hypothetical protein
MSTLLQDRQKLMNDLGPSRKTPYGTPIPWQAQPVTKFGSLVAPAYGAANQGQILLYKTPQNFFSLICGIVLGFAGPGASPLPGDLIFTIDIDRPLGSTIVGYPEKDYGSIQFPIGSFMQYQWPVEFRHRNGEELRIKGQTVSNVTVGPGNFLTAAIFGWQWSEEGWE